MTKDDCTYCPCLECQRTKKTSMDEKIYVRCKKNNDVRFIKNGTAPWLTQENINGRWYSI